LNYFVDIHLYLGLPNTIRVALAAFQLYIPILASSLVFARLFQQSEKSSFDFGMNILGALFGGMLEYSSLVVGVRNVYLMALVVFLAMVPLLRRSLQTSQQRDDLASQDSSLIPTRIRN
jgi:hypothetical protein